MTQKRIKYRLYALCIIIPMLGCSSAKVATNPPPHYLTTPVVDLSTPVPMPNVEREIVTSMKATNVNCYPDPPINQKLNILAVSGGGQFGSYGAGVLLGWSAQGNRPKFDIVTGISSGALIAILVYGGEKYDPTIQRLFTNLEKENLFDMSRPLRNVVQKQSLSTAEPLVQLIDKTINCEFFNDMKLAHQAGRRLYIGTVNVESRLPVFWDLGAIACSSRPNAHALVKTILLASVSVPVSLPAVPIEVIVNGQRVVEQHADGGGVSQAFVRFGPHHPKPNPARPGEPWLSGSNLYVIAGGKLNPEILEPDFGFVPGLQSAVSATLFALFRSDTWRMYTLCLASGMKFNLTAVPDDLPAPPDSLGFDLGLQQRFFQVGFDSIFLGTTWRVTPPGVEPGEESLPRTGLEFFVPAPRKAPGPFISSSTKRQRLIRD